MKYIIGKVVSIKTPKTVIIEIESVTKHPLYKKIIRRKRRMAVHNEIEVKLNDQVMITKCRPISKTKHFQINKIVKK